MQVQRRIRYGDGDNVIATQLGCQLTIHGTVMLVVGHGNGCREHHRVVGIVLRQVVNAEVQLHTFVILQQQFSLMPELPVNLSCSCLGYLLDQQLLTLRGKGVSMEPDA